MTYFCMILKNNKARRLPPTIHNVALYVPIRGERAVVLIASIGIHPTGHITTRYVRPPRFAIGSSVSTASCLCAAHPCASVFRDAVRIAHTARVG